MREPLSKLILGLESQLGTRDMVNMILDALVDTIEDFDTKDDKRFCKEFEEVVKDVKNTSPRIGLLIEDFYEIWSEVEKEEHCKRNLNNPCKKCKDLKRVIVKKVKDLKKKNRTEKKAITKNVIKSIKKGDTILIHTYSHTVIDALKAAIKKKRFSCIIAEQEHEKTMAMIQDLHKAQIPFKVIPEHMLSHMEKEITKVFLGAVTLNSFQYVISNAGTMAVVSEFKDKAPIFLLMGTRKCSYWKALQHHHSFKEKQVKVHINRPLTYKRFKFSHDRVPLNLFDYIITEQGKWKTNEMSAYYKKEYKKRHKWRKAFFNI